MNTRLILAASLALATPAAFAQQPAAPPQQTPDGNVRFGPQDGGPRAPKEFFLASAEAPAGDWHGRDRGEGDMHGGPMMMHGRHGEHGDFWKNPEVVKRVGLSPDQVKKLDDLSLAGKLQMIKLHAAVEEQEVMLHATMSDGPALDQKKAEVEIDKAADARAALEKADARLKLSLRAVLTPDQWTKLHAPPEHAMGQHGPMGGGERHHGGPMGQPGPGGPMGGPGQAPQAPPA